MKNRISCILLCLLVSTALSDEDVDDAATVETVEQPVIAVQYQSPTVTDPTKVYLAEHFDDHDQVQKRWIKSQAKKEGIAEEEIAKYDGVWAVEAAARDALTGDSGLVLKSKAKHAAIAAALDRPFAFKDKPLVVQYEVLLQEGQECGGAYLKLLSEKAPADLSLFHDKTPYTIMFGPDKCGNDHKLHFIFRHRNPLNGTIQEKHCRKPDERIEEYFSDKLPHLYTLVVWPQNTYEIKVDGKIVNTGHLLMDFEPPVNPPKEIEDVTDTKPDHWDDREKIPDPEATKPSDWDEDAPAQIVDESAVKPEGWLEDEPTHVPDADAIKPADWDTEMDGEWEPPLVENPACAEAVGCGPWEPPLINNPAFKGKWRQPTIDNPNYRGKWRPGRIPNPDYFEEKHPFLMPHVTAVGFELWSMSQDILFDNIIITDDIVVAAAWAAETFDKKRQKIAKDSESVVQRLANLTNEYPALWGVYILVLSVPVVFLLYICCKPSSSAASSGQRQEREEEQEGEAEKKKTDDITEDVEEEEVEVEKKEVVEAEGEEDEDGEKNSEPDSEEDNEQHAEVGAGETADSGDKPSSDGGARKRKVRKE